MRRRTPNAGIVSEGARHVFKFHLIADAFVDAVGAGVSDLVSLSDSAGGESRRSRTESQKRFSRNR
jgi:hypothetical protein